MTTIVNLITTSYISSPYSLLSDGIAVLVVGLLLVLLTEKVLLDAYEGEPSEAKARAFSVVIVPMLFILAVVVFLRLAQIVNVG